MPWRWVETMTVALTPSLQLEQLQGPDPGETGGDMLAIHCFASITPDRVDFDQRHLLRGDPAECGNAQQIWWLMAGGG